MFPLLQNELAQQQNQTLGQPMSDLPVFIPEMEATYKPTGILFDVAHQRWHAVWRQHDMTIDLGSYPTARAALAAYEQCDEDMRDE